MAFFDVYVDESLDGTGRRLVVAGYASSTDRWRIFAAEWKARLERDGLSHFHMKKFKNRHSALFAHLSAEKRAELINDLVIIIRAHVTGGAICRIDTAEYNSLTSPKFRSSYGGAYFAALSGCVHILQEMARPEDGFSLILEAGHKGVDGAIHQLRDYQESVRLNPAHNSGGINITGFAVFNKQDMRPLQAADILAHCALTGRNDRVSQSVLDRITNDGGVVSRQIEWGEYEIKKLIQTMADDEDSRAECRHTIHTVSRFLGNFGIKVRKIPEGIEIDATKQKELTIADIEEMLARDPSLEYIPPPKKVEN